MSTINIRNSQAAEDLGSLEEAAPIGIQLPSRTVSTSDSPGIPVEIIPSQPGHDVPGWKSIIVHFSPSWFTVSMGTGIVSILLYSIPFKTKWLYYLSIITFFLNAVFFCVIFSMTVLRYILAPDRWIYTLSDPTLSPFLGTIPIAFATLIEMWVFVCVPAWGNWATTLIWAFWIADVVFAVTITVSLTFILISNSRLNSLRMITAVQLLPISATIIVSGVGAEVAEVLPTRERALATLMASYILWGMSMPLAWVVIVIYYQRLAVHKLPSREVIVSCFLPLGPLGFGSYSIMYLGKVARTVFLNTEFLDPVAGQCAYVVGFMVALIMWGFGLMWLVLSVATIHYSWPFPFNMGWWGFTFPLGVFAASAIQLGNEMPSLFFRVLGTIFSTVVIIMWIIVLSVTARGIWEKTIFVAPSLTEVEMPPKITP